MSTGIQAGTSCEEDGEIICKRMKKWQVKKIERDDAIRASCYTMQGKWLVKRTGKLYIKIWRLAEGSMSKREKEECRKTANYAKVRKEERESLRDVEHLDEKEGKNRKNVDACFFKFPLI